MKDPLYRQILDRLNEDLDPNEFEDCVCSLLRDEYPTLVPVAGGGDFGMDGAIADGEGEAFPLIVTTGKDPLRNLRKNLDAQLEKRFPRKKAIFATSRRLTPQQRFKLEETAREREFILIQVIDQRGIADRLYRSSHWRRSLLGLTGTPSALSVVPLSKRPLLDLEPVGRAADLEWLHGTTGDRVLVGQPGSGKTFLLYHLARQGWGLFLTSDDPTAIADAIRDQQPAVIIVDDAQVDPERLARLRQLGDEIGAEFSIVAVTWKGALDRVREALGGLPADQVRQLELLTRAELVQVLEQVGVNDREWVRELVNQSANKPGLAVTLADLALRGDLESVLEGTALRRTLKTAFQGLIGRDPLLPLAAFSLGGDAGMSIDEVGEFLGPSRREVFEEASALAAGGVLSEIDRHTLAVRPPVLRWNLLRTVFFSDRATDQPYQDLLERAPSLPAAVEEILLSVARAHAVIPETELRELVERADSPSVWSLFAALGEERARWVLEHYPGDLLDVARVVLMKAPEVVIPILLRRAMADEKPLDGWSEHPLDILGYWIRDLRALELSEREPISRRRRLAQAAKDFLRKGGDQEVGVRALCLALSPKLEGHNRDPGLGNRVEWSLGLLGSSGLTELRKIWEDVRDAIELEASPWGPLERLLLESSSLDVIPGPEVTALLDAFLENVIRDLADRAGGSPGIRSKLQEWTRRRGLSVEVEADPDFEILFRDDSLDFESWEKAEQVREERAEALLSRWREKKPEEVAERLAFFESEAALVHHTSPRLTPLLARKLAEEVEAPGAWLKAFLQHELPRDLVEPFLDSISAHSPEDWQETIRGCLDHERYRGDALAVILRQSDPPAELFERAIELVESCPALVESLSRQGQLPLPTLSRLLQHSGQEVALHAAVGEWVSEPRGKVEAKVKETWREAILRADAEPRAVGAKYEVQVILAGDTQLAFDWLRRRLGGGELPSQVIVPGHSLWAVAISSLSQEQRSVLLNEVPAVDDAKVVLRALVGDDVHLYRQLLALPRLSNHHLVPLHGLPGPAWAEKALAALEAGHEPEKIADATVWGGVQTMSLETWQEWADAFAAYEHDERDGLSTVARCGKEIADRWREKAEKDSRQLELAGF